MTDTGKYIINVRSSADMVQGHGVLSAGQEQIKLVREGLSGRFQICEDNKCSGSITHYHTVNFRYFLELPLAKLSGKAVGYVHFLPETIDGSLQLPKIAKAVFYRYLITFYKSMDALVVVNPIFVDKLVALGVARDKISYIPNYVDDQQFHPVAPAEKRRLRVAYGLEADRFTVVCAGQLQSRKGVMEFADLARRMPDLQFVWAGGFSFGKMTDGYAEIGRLLEHHPSNLHFPGMIPRESMNGLYNLGDVMFLPSYSELFPMTILEAMSCNIPLLLRDIDVYPKILFDFYRKGSTQEEFEAELRRLQSDPECYTRAKDAAKRGHAFYSKEHVLTMWDTFYTALATAPEFRFLKHRKRAVV
ncbi:MAG: glycosyltransferase family 4 protein [Angelakisella sp.]